MAKRTGRSEVLTWRNDYGRLVFKKRTSVAGDRKFNAPTVVWPVALSKEADIKVGDFVTMNSPHPGMIIIKKVE